MNEWHYCLVSLDLIEPNPVGSGSGSDPRPICAAAERRERREGANSLEAPPSVDASYGCAHLNRSLSGQEVGRRMEDIEDLVAGGGGGGGAPPGFRPPLTAVGVKPKRRGRSRPDTSGDVQRSPVKDSVAARPSNVPGTQVLTSLPPNISFVSLSPPPRHLLLLRLSRAASFLPQTIYIKTFGCSHNQASTSPSVCYSGEDGSAEFADEPSLKFDLRN